MPISHWLLLVAGLALLVAGAELLVRGASSLAQRLRIPPLVVGLTVVAFGTSSPELAVSVGAALSARADIAVGNVIGSNIFNVLFILGLSALITPLRVNLKLVRLDVPLMVAVSVAFLVLSQNGRIGRLEGLALVSAGIGYTVFLYWQGRREGLGIEANEIEELGAPSYPMGLTVSLVLIAFGLLLLGVGARWLVDSATAIARLLGASELFIGLTIVAVGTSLPELATSVIASLRGERDMAVGNIIGSNTFNILWVLGVASALSPSGVAVSSAVRGFDLPVMVAVAFACLPIFFTGFSIERWEGGLFLGYYLAYVGFLLLAARHYPGLPAISAAMLWLVLPLTAITLGVLSWRAWRGHQNHRPAGADLP